LVRKEAPFRHPPADTGIDVSLMPVASSTRRAHRLSGLPVIVLAVCALPVAAQPAVGGLCHYPGDTMSQWMCELIINW